MTFTSIKNHWLKNIDYHYKGSISISILVGFLTTNYQEKLQVNMHTKLSGFVNNPYYINSISMYN